ncbi:MAG: hypothetical protein B7Z62_05900 [Deltaproteobacteria bacterium 37-65-8]|nr:MAG: hypothetical protein B7Z74_04170 [Deltaproteobacteria bacterium 21-66-5]OYV97507.1 MAG: hypothetical protein B7Z62_05900 [Deltaproteobacteria bacterium 37-65-8]
MQIAPGEELQALHLIQFVSAMEFVTGNLTDSHREDGGMARETEKKDFSKAEEVREFPKMSHTKIGLYPRF